MSDARRPVAVLGGGSFGTAMTKIVADNGYQTRLWVRDPETAAVINASRENARYLPGAELPDSVVATESLEEALDGAGMVFVAVPSKAFVDVLGQAARWVPDGTLAVSCTKGIHGDGFLLMSQLLGRLWPQARVGVLSGPRPVTAWGKYRHTHVIESVKDLPELIETEFI